MLDEKLRRLRVVTLYIVSALGRHDFSFRQIIPKKQSIAQITGSAAKLSGLVFVDQAFTVSWGLTGFKGYRPESRPCGGNRWGLEVPCNRQMLNIGKLMGIIWELPPASPTKGLGSRRLAKPILLCRR